MMILFLQGIKSLDGSDSNYLGRAAQRRRSILNMSSPIERGVVTNWDDMEKIWQYVFDSELRVDPSEHPVLLTEALGNSKNNRERMTQVKLC